MFIYKLINELLTFYFQITSLVFKISLVLLLAMIWQAYKEFTSWLNRIIHRTAVLLMTLLMFTFILLFPSQLFIMALPWSPLLIIPRKTLHSM